MGDHFVFMVDRLLTESTLGAALESRNRSLQSTTSDEDEKVEETSSHKIDLGDLLYPRKMVECRICQDEDEDRNMETPCSCCGSLKYAHRKCVQKWCNEKGNTMCEICHQQFKPGYTAPPPLFQISRIPMNFRGNWEVYRRESNPNGPHFIAMVSTDRNLTNPDFHEHSSSVMRSLICCRSVALIFMLLLVLRHTLPVLASRSSEYSFPLLLLLLLRSVGIILPIYIIIRVLTAVQRHRLRQVSSSSQVASSDEETEDSTMQHQPQPEAVHAGQISHSSAPQEILVPTSPGPPQSSQPSQEAAVQIDPFFLPKAIPVPPQPILAPPQPRVHTYYFNLKGGRPMRPLSIKPPVRPSSGTCVKANHRQYICWNLIEVLVHSLSQTLQDPPDVKSLQMNNKSPL